MKRQTRLSSHGTVETTPSAVYGSGPVILRIGNGGAGATGLIEALAIAYLAQRRGEPGSIEWVCNHSRNTQLALLHGVIDIALTYERDQEALAAEEGWSITHGCVFHDHFCLAGPVSDPADILSTTSIQEAFVKIARSKASFHSRADGSATMAKERAIWGSCHLQPYDEPDSAWYKMSQHTSARALTAADAAGSYLLTDRSTLLRQVADGHLHSTTVFFEPTDVTDILMNSCYALHAPNPSQEAQQFLQYVSWRPAGQAVITSFGAVQAGMPFFAPVGDGYAKRRLRGGRPIGRKWVSNGVDERSRSRM